MISIADPEVGSREFDRLRAVVGDGALADGDEVRQFESEFAAYCDATTGVATCNGTAALHAALHAVGVEPGDTVVTTPFSFIATANAIRFCGADPVFADVDPDTYNIDPESVRTIVRERDVDAILPVHLYGLPARMDRLLDVADDAGIPLVEDAAQAHGAEFDGQRVGSFGDAACFSFYPTKNMTTGEGGIVVTDRDDVAERTRRFVDHGRSSGYRHESLGHNFRMTNLAAAIGRVQLERLPRFTERRRTNAHRFTEALRGTALQPPHEPSNARHVYHQYTIRTTDRDALRTYLEVSGVGTGIYYPIPIHRQPAYEGVEASAPEAERAADEVLSLPVHPGLTDSDRMTIINALLDYEATEKR